MSKNFNSKKWNEFRISMLQENRYDDYEIPIEDYRESEKFRKQFTAEIYPLIDKWAENFTNSYESADDGTQYVSLNKFIKELYKLIREYELEKSPNYEVPE